MTPGDGSARPESRRGMTGSRLSAAMRPGEISPSPPRAQRPEWLTLRRTSRSPSSARWSSSASTACNGDPARRALGCGQRPQLDRETGGDRRERERRPGSSRRRSCRTASTAPGTTSSGRRRSCGRRRDRQGPERCRTPGTSPGPSASRGLAAATRRTGRSAGAHGREPAGAHAGDGSSCECLLLG